MIEKKPSTILLECIQTLVYEPNVENSVYQLVLSTAYAEGLGNREKDPEMADNWLLKSAGFGNAQAFLCLGHDNQKSSYQKGSINHLKVAKEYFQLTLSAGEARGAFRLGKLFTRALSENDGQLYLLLGIASDKECYQKAKNYFIQDLYLLRYLLKAQPENKQLRKEYQDCIEGLHELEELYPIKSTGTEQMRKRIEETSEISSGKAALDQQIKDSQSSDNAAEGSEKIALVESSNFKKPKGGRSRWSHIKPSDKRRLSSITLGKSENPDDLSIDASSHILNSPRRHKRLTSDQSQSYLSPSPTLKEISEAFKKQVEEEVQKWSDQQIPQQKKYDESLVAKSNAQDVYYHLLCRSLKKEAKYYARYQNICQQIEKGLDGNTLILPDLLQDCQEVRMGYKELYAQLASKHNLFKTKLSETIDAILAIESSLFEKQVSFDHIVETVKRIDKSLQNDEKISVKEFSDRNAIFDDIMRYLAKGIPLDANRYLINDVRNQGFFHQDSCRHALLARATNYYRATQLILRYSKIDEKNIKLKAKELDSVYQKCCKILHQPKKAVDFNQEVFMPFVTFLMDNSPMAAAPVPGKASKPKDTKKHRGWSKKEAVDALTQAEFMVNWTQKIPVIVTICAFENGDTLVQLDIPLDQGQRTQDQAKELEYPKELEHPQAAWFKQLPEWQKSFWRDECKQLFTEPSTLRAYPDLPFYLHHCVLIFDDQYELKHDSTRSRSSIVVPYQLYKNCFSDCLKLTEQNIAQYISVELPLAISLQQSLGMIKEGDRKPILVPILYQTLLSNTNKGLAKVLSIPGSENQMIDVKYEVFSQFTEQLLSVLAKKMVCQLLQPIFINTNYAVNQFDENRKIGKLLADPIKNAGEVSKLFYCAQNVFERIAQRAEEKQRCIGQLITHLEELRINFSDEVPLKHERFKAVADHIRLPRKYARLEKVAKYLASALLMYAELIRAKDQRYNLLLAGIETSLVIAMGGVVLATCKSGKDRTGLLQIAVDALEFYFYLSFELSNLIRNDLTAQQQKSHYYSIFNTLFCSGHQQLLASTNAVGCIGLKSVKGVLPDDLYQFIERQEGGVELLEANDDCSNLNRPEKQEISVNLRYKALPPANNRAADWITEVRRDERDYFSFFKTGSQSLIVVQESTENKTSRKLL